MKKLFKVLLGVLFLGSVGFAMADEDHRDDRDRDHAKVRIVIAPKRHHHRRRHHPEVHSSVSLKIGGDGDHHDDHHDGDR